MGSLNIIDIEASGLDLHSYPIEVAILMQGKVYSWLIKREDAWCYWDPAAENLHGITRGTLAAEGQTAADVAQAITDCVAASDGVFYSDAITWESTWLTRLFAAAKKPLPFQVQCLYDLFDKSKAKLFYETKGELAESGRYRVHRAGQDVQMIYEAYLAASDTSLAARDTPIS